MAGGERNNSASAFMPLVESTVESGDDLLGNMDGHRPLAAFPTADDVVSLRCIFGRLPDPDRQLVSHAASSSRDSAASIGNDAGHKRKIINGLTNARHPCRASGAEFGPTGSASVFGWVP